MWISYAKTMYGQEEIDAVVACLEDRLKCLRLGVPTGEYVRVFEKVISRMFEKSHGLYVNSGSSALYVGMEAKRYEPGSQVITPVLTFSTTVGCIVKSGLTPAFVDIGYDDYCIDVAKIEEMITSKTVAILAPNLLGNICKWDEIRNIADKYNLDVIEDSADTLGGTLKKKSSGHWSDWSITSFYGSHIITCAGNGGMVCTNDDEHSKQIKLLRSWGRSSSIFDERSESIENRFNKKLHDIEYDAKFIFDEVGYNLEGSEIGAAFGLKQMESLQNNISIRKENFLKQTKFFENYEDLFVLPKQTEGSESAWLAYPITIKDKAPFTRKDFQIFLEKKNIQTRTIFSGNIIKQPGFKNIKMRLPNNETFRNADRIMKNGVLLACHNALTVDEFEYMHSTIDEFVSSF